MTRFPVRVERIVEHLPDGTDSHVVQLAVDPRLVLPGILRALTEPASRGFGQPGDMFAVCMHWDGSASWRAAVERIASDPRIETALTVVLTPDQAKDVSEDLWGDADCMECDCGRLVDIDGTQCSACVEHGEYRDAGLHR